ncbi:ArfGap-domain-containing protein [Trametopsis cervina]|nr:ArfGap-domain-containing protein [Trametopsis cervina]
MDQTIAKRTLQDLIKNEELGNKKCVDCGNPNPQWATVSFAIFLCLQCAGVHRGFGVHVSFVRSVSMDTWQEEQIRRMQAGGNKPFKDFMKAYPADQSGYTVDMNAYDTYHSWAATQYREKVLDAELAGKQWSPSAPPSDRASPSNSLGAPGRPTSAQGLRKSRSSARSGVPRSGSPASFSSTPTTSSNAAANSYPDQKAANESFFAGLGETNASRPDDLPPSQGGRYQGFGSTPAPSHPSFGLSSAAAPTLNDLQENPMAALTKGWSLFSSAVVGATRVVSENIIQPGMEKVLDPNFQSQVKGYVSEAGKRAGDLGTTANTWTKHTLGVDVAEGVGGVVGSVRDTIGGPSRRGYGTVEQSYVGEGSSLYHDHEEDDFFDQYSPAGQTHMSPQDLSSGPTSRASTTQTKKADDWDEWKDF